MCGYALLCFAYFPDIERVFVKLVAPNHPVPEHRITETVYTQRDRAQAQATVDDIEYMITNKPELRRPSPSACMYCVAKGSDALPS